MRAATGRMMTVSEQWISTHLERCMCPEIPIQGSDHAGKMKSVSVRYILTGIKNGLCQYPGDAATGTLYRVYALHVTHSEGAYLGMTLGLHGWAASLASLRGGVIDNQVYHDYQKVMSGDRNVLFKMKEIWFYLSASFPGCEKEMKKIKKAEKCLEYERAVDMMFEKRAGRMSAE